jgi:hypothetical protein
MTSAILTHYYLFCSQKIVLASSIFNDDATNDDEGILQLLFALLLLPCCQLPALLLLFACAGRLRLALLHIRKIIGLESEIEYTSCKRNQTHPQ